MLQNYLSMSQILLGLENTLRIEYTENNITSIKRKSKQNLENIFGMKITKSIYEMQTINALVSDSIDSFLSSILENLKSLSMYMSFCMFTKTYGQNLRDVNYLGFAEENLMAVLKFLQDEQLYEKRQTFIDDLVSSSDKLDIGIVKRLLVILAVLEMLDIKEGVALIAQYLYISSTK